MPATQRQPGDPHGRAGATRQEETLCGKACVDVDQLRAGSDRDGCLTGGAGGPAGRDRVQARHVDDQAGARRVAAVAVSSRVGCHLHVVLAAEGETALHIACRLALGDGRGSLRVDRVVQVAGCRYPLSVGWKRVPVSDPLSFAQSGGPFSGSVDEGVLSVGARGAAARTRAPRHRAAGDHPRSQHGGPA